MSKRTCFNSSLSYCFVNINDEKTGFEKLRNRKRIKRKDRDYATFQVEMYIVFALKH